MANFRKLGTDFTDGLQTPHYTNGRLLTAEDLQREQRSSIERLTQLGKGFTEGVIEGFRVTAIAGNKNLQVTAGSGINRNGNVVKLSADTVALPVQPVTGDEDTPIRRSGQFEGCEGDESQPASTPVTSGAYLLTAAPLARLEGVAPRRAPSGVETATCANQWEVEGVEFKIIRLEDYQRPTGIRSQRNRNLLAHWFYGSSKLNRLMLELFHFDPRYTGFATIAPEDYTPCDLPLAVFFWDDNQIMFVDEWAVRCRLSHPYPGHAWTANVSDRRAAEGEARFLQFQAQLDDLRASAGSNASNVRATVHFAYLPPVGFLPVNPFELIVDDVFDEAITEEQLARIERLQLTTAQVRQRVRTNVSSSLGSNTTFQLDRFFEDLLPDEYVIVHEDEVHDRLHQSWVQRPITLPPPPAPQFEPFPGYFELVLPDENVLSITEENINAVLGTVTGSSGFLAGASSGNIAAVENQPASTNEVTGAVETGFMRLNLNRGARRINAVDDIIIGTGGDNQDDQEPLVDILVIDELLAPYRQYLLNQMPNRIDSAIASLSSGGGVFTGANDFASVNSTIHNRFLLNSFLENAIHTGIANMNQLGRFTIGDPLPPFYVVFVRHRPPRRTRPLRSA